MKITGIPQARKEFPDAALTQGASGNSRGGTEGARAGDGPHPRDEWRRPRPPRLEEGVPPEGLDGRAGGMHACLAGLLEFSNSTCLHRSWQCSRIFIFKSMSYEYLASCYDFRVHPEHVGGLPGREDLLTLEFPYGPSQRPLRGGRTPLQ